MVILMNAYGDHIQAFALRIVRNHTAAEDVRQQVFYEALLGFDSFGERSSLWGWLCGIARHRCLDELRRLRRTNTSDDLEFLDGLVEPPAATMDADRVATRRALEQCLGELSVSLRDQLLMRFFLGLSYAEIGEVVDASHSTVQVRVSRIVHRLRQCLRGEGLAR